MSLGAVLGRVDGRIWALLAASSLGLNTTLASLAYATGATPVLILVVRALAAAAFLGVWLALLGRLRLHRRDAGAIALATLGTTGVSLGYLSSVYFIPVSLAAIIFFTFPLVVAVVDAALERRWPAIGEIALFLLAFVGLALAIGPSFQSLDWRGIALAFMASTSSTLLFIVAKRHLTHLGDRVVSFQVNLFGGGIVGLGALLVFPNLLLPPGTWEGLGLTAAICLAYLIGVTMLFTAVRTAGAAKSALFFNIEPVVSITLAFLLLGESLSTLQLLGGGLVITALLAGSLERRDHLVPPPPGRPS